MERKEIHLKYDPNIYYWIAEMGRLVEIDLKALRSLDVDVLYDENYLESIKDKKVGPDIIFTNEYVFDTTHLGQILKIHTPIEANAYWDSCEKNVLTLKFYKL
jgi:hypothetical protein